MLLNALFYPWKEGLLHGWIYEVVHCELLCEPVSEEKEEGFTNASGQCNHAKVTGSSAGPFL